MMHIVVMQSASQLFDADQPTAQGISTQMSHISLGCILLIKEEKFSFPQKQWLSLLTMDFIYLPSGTELKQFQLTGQINRYHQLGPA